MDWSNVTSEDLIEALREVNWASPQRPLSEFFFRFTVPLSFSKWDSRLKCNLYYYRTNYFIMILFILGMGFLRRPLCVVAALMTALSIAFLNDSFTGTFSEKMTSTVRQFSPHLVAKMRHPLTEFHDFILCFVSCALLTILRAFAVGLLATMAHASFRVPNLKARLNTFRAVWRNHNEL